MAPKMIRDERGQALNEYIFLVGLLTLVLLAGMMTVNSAIAVEFEQLRGAVGAIAAVSSSDSTNSTDQDRNNTSSTGSASEQGNGNQGNGNQSNGNQNNSNQGNGNQNNPRPTR